MWNNTRLLNLIATALFVLAGFVAIQQLVVAAVNSPFFPLRQVAVRGSLEFVEREQLAEALAGRPLGNFFAADLELVREWIEDIPWVRHASVRRAWPDTLEVTIEEHRALARWSDKRYVNTAGELFSADGARPEALARLAALPRFGGPAGTEAEVTRRFHRFAEITRPLATEIAGLSLSARYAWELRLSDGLTIELGREPAKDGARDAREPARDALEERLGRFVRTYPETLAKLSRRLNYVDLRYPGGFALRVPDIEKLEEERQREERVKKKA